MSQRGTIWSKNTYSRSSDSPVYVRACIAVLIRASKRCCSCPFYEIGRWAQFFEFTKPSPVYHSDFAIVKSRPPFGMDILLVPAANHDRKGRVASQSYLASESSILSCTPARRKPA